jgi:anaerobic dimethyl sulfoxide reductase subunit B
MSHYAFYFDISRCSGCMACEVACMDQNDEAADGVNFRQVTRHEETTGSGIRISFLSLACLHCADPPCARACPNKAISKDDEYGAVEIDRSLCIGCHACQIVCPFGAVKFSRNGKMTKCDLCVARLQNGLKPACVHTCPTRALEVGPVEEISAMRAERASIKMLKQCLSPEDSIS